MNTYFRGDFKSAVAQPSKFAPKILSIAFLRCLSNGAHVICVNFRRRIGKASKGWRGAKEGGEPLAGKGKCP
jgi:hypothetical protein